MGSRQKNRTFGQSSRRRLCRQGFFLLLLGAALAASPALSVVSQLPDLGQARGDRSEQAATGLRYLTYMNRQGLTTQDPATTYYLEQSLLPLLPAYDLDDRNALTIFGVTNRSFNAFALPGGLIGVHDGLFAQLSTTAEVQAILAHELAHLALDHHARLAVDAQRSSAVIIASFLLAPLALQLGPDVAFGMLYGAQGLAAQQQLAFSRRMEEEADRVALAALESGNLPLDGIIGAYESMAQQQRIQSGQAGASYPGTHPDVRARLSDLRNRLTEMSLSGETVDLPLCWVQADRGLPVHAGSNGPCAQYPRQNGETEAERWRRLLAMRPGQPYLLYRASDWAVKANADTTELRNLIRSQVKLVPDSWLAALATIQLNGLSEAELGRSVAVLYEGAPANDLGAWNHIRTAYDTLDNRARAFRAQAQSRWIAGEPAVAIEELQRAIGLANPDSRDQREWRSVLRRWEAMQPQ